ncbi:hypothetical protein [Rickettsia sp.]
MLAVKPTVLYGSVKPTRCHSRVDRKICSVSYRGLTTVSKKQ